MRQQMRGPPGVVATKTTVDDVSLTGEMVRKRCNPPAGVRFPASLGDAVTEEHKGGALACPWIRHGPEKHTIDQSHQLIWQSAHALAQAQLAGQGSHTSFSYNTVYKHCVFMWLTGRRFLACFGHIATFTETQEQ